MLPESSPLHVSASALHYTTTSYPSQGGVSVVEHGVMGQGQGLGQGQGQGLVFDRVMVRERDGGSTLQQLRGHDQV